MNKQIDKRLIQETNAYSCLECGKCTGTCPVARYSNSFSPRQILAGSIHNTHPDVYRVADLWSCLTCMRCDEVCPSNISYIDFIHLIRQFRGTDKREGTCSHGGILESISKIMTSPKLKQDRLSGLDTRNRISADSDYLYFMGCLPYFDVLFTDLEVQSLEIARSTLEILNFFDIKPQLLADEKCCGHDSYWNGDMKTFELLARENLKQIEKSKAKTIITSCPECYRTLKLDYPKKFGKQAYEVFHISEFLVNKINEKKPALKMDQTKLTFQDPCRLGRHMGIYDAPRQTMQAIEGVEYIEMGHHHRRSICCGVSGWMNCSQVSKQIQKSRLNEARATTADILVTACAKCQIHFKCAMHDPSLNEAESIQIKDITQIVSASLH